MAPRGSIELATTRLLTRFSARRCLALAAARSTAAWSPISQSKHKLPGCRSGSPGHTTGRPGSRARAGNIVEVTAVPGQKAPVLAPADRLADAVLLHRGNSAPGCRLNIGSPRAPVHLWQSREFRE